MQLLITCACIFLTFGKLKKTSPSPVSVYTFEISVVNIEHQAPGLCSSNVALLGGVRLGLGLMGGRLAAMHGAGGLEVVDGRGEEVFGLLLFS